MNKQEERQRHLEKQKLSGKSIKAYCAEHGLVAGSWHYNREKYSGRSLTASKFVKAVIVKEKASVKCELHNKSGIRLIFDEWPDSSWVREVLS